MSQVLYRKYRPQTFAEVIGQDVIKTILQNALKHGQVAHAYLFTGPRGVGKTTVARILAKAVNCLHMQQDGDADNKCANCEALRTGRFLDLVEIDAASYTGVDNIREIIEHVRFAPTTGKYKVFIIDEVHMLSKAAFNALLKTLEEPPAHAIFIMATTESHKVPETVVSRSQRFDFRRVSKRDILKLFELVLKEEDISIAKEALSLLADAAEGSFRDALSLLDQVISFGAKKITVEQVEDALGITRISSSQNFLSLLISGNDSGAVKFVKDLAVEGRDLMQFTRNFLEYLRLVLFVKVGVESASELGLSSDDAEQLRGQSSEITSARLLEIIRRVLEAYRESRQTPVPELPLLVAILSLGPVKATVTGVPVLSPAVSRQRKDPADAPNLNLALGKIMEQWVEVLRRVKEYNHSLISSLRLGRLIELNGDELLIAFPYNFHKETVDARKNRIVIEQVLEEVYAAPLRIKVLVERELKNEPATAFPPKDDLLGEALRILGESGG